MAFLGTHSKSVDCNRIFAIVIFLIRFNSDLLKITSYDDITSDPVTKNQLIEIYGENVIQNVDLFVGSLAEDHLLFLCRTGIIGTKRSTITVL